MKNTSNKDFIIQLIIAICAVLTFIITGINFIYDTFEDLQISVSTRETSVHLQYNKDDPTPAYYILQANIDIVNNSNIPIFIDDLMLCKSDYFPDIDNVSVMFEKKPEIPISIGAKASKILKASIKVEIPDQINKLLISKFSYDEHPSNEEIGTYLFYIKNRDLNNSLVEMKKDKNKHPVFCYKEYKIFTLIVNTTRKNSFSESFFGDFAFSASPSNTKITRIYANQKTLGKIYEFIGMPNVASIVLIVVTIFTLLIFFCLRLKKNNADL